VNKNSERLYINLIFIILKVFLRKNKIFFIFCFSTKKIFNHFLYRTLFKKFSKKYNCKCRKKHFNFYK